MNANNSGGNSTTASVYRLIQSPAPICMFYFAHPFGIASPASGAKLAQIRDRATKGKACSPSAVAPENGTKPAKPGQCRRHKSQTGKEPSVKAHRKLNGYSCSQETEARLQKPEAKPSVRKSKKHRKHRRISNFEKFLLEIQENQHTCGDALSKIRRIDQENRITRLVPWPSIIWNRDFLMPPLLQALALQHGREIPDIEQILRTVRSAWNTPKSQRSNLRSQDSRESSSSNWDLSSTCDSYCCYQNHRMGAGTYANAASPGPGLLRRRYSVPEIIMRKHTLAQQKSGDEPLLLHDTNHNVIDVVNKNVLLGGVRVGRSPTAALRLAGYRKSPGMRRAALGTAALSRTEPGTRSSSVESGIAATGTTSHEWIGTALIAGTTATLTAGGSDPNLTASLKHPQARPQVGPAACGGSLCNGLGSSRAVATGTGGSLRCINNNSLTGSSSSVNGLVACGGMAPTAAVAGVGSAALVGIGCGHQHVLASGGGIGGGFAFRDGGSGGDFSMRKTTLLRRMWSRELRRYERSGSWSPPLRRAPRRIYSVESMVPATPPEGDAGPGGGVRRPSSSGSTSTSSNASSAAARDCGTGVTSGTTTPGTASCLECAQLERQYLGGYAADRTVSQCARDANNGGEVDGTTDGIDPTVDDRRRRRARRMCSSQAADLGESQQQQQQAVVSGTVPGPTLGSSGGSSSVVIELDDEVDAPDDLSASSSVSSVASQSFREVRPARAESELNEFLLQERLQASGCDGDGGPDGAVGGQTARLGPGHPGAGDHSGERAPADGGSAGAGPTGTEAAGAVGQRAVRSDDEEEEDDDASSVGALSALSGSSDSDTGASEGAGSEGEPSTGREEPEPGGNAPHATNGGELDQYIASLLLENLEPSNPSEATVEPTPDSGPDPDRQNNNEATAVAATDDPGMGRATTPSAAGMKQKLTGKYIGGGGGVVCNSPPSDKRKAACSPAADKENAEDVANNNNNVSSKREEREAGNRHRHRKQKEADALEAVVRQDRHPSGQKRRSKDNGFYLTQREGRDSQIDLNGKYYFPAYGLETDPSDNTDVASEPEPQVLGKVGTGSTYGGELAALARSVVVPRFSAMPRTESMEVQPSTSAEDEDGRGGGAGSESDDDDSLVDSLDGFQPMHGPATAPRKRKDAAATTATTDSQTSPGTDRSPRHEKGEAFFVPIQDSGRLKQIEQLVVADTMPLRIKERLNNRRRLMKWKQEQESLKKQRKMMRMIEQKRFYGAPAIQVISTIDKAISRKEYLSPAGRKTVFGGGARSGEADAGPFRAMKPKKRTSDGAAGLRSGLGMLESYKIDGKGNMQIQTPASGGGSSAPSGRRPAAAAAAKSPWGTSAERRPAGGKSTGGATTAPTTATSTLPSSKGRPGGGRTPAAEVRRKQVLKDVQQMQLYPQADLTPDIEGGPRRVYQKTEIQEGDKHIEILEIVECADSAPRSRPAVRPVVRVRSAGRHGGTSSGAAATSRHHSRIPVPVYRFGHFRRSNQSRDGSPLAGINPKVDRMIADLLLEALANPDEMGIKFVKTPENLRESSGRSSKRSPGAAAAGASSKKKATAAGSSSSAAAAGTANTLTPRRTASGRYKQKFEVIPEERSSVSVGSSTEELSASSSVGRSKKAHASPRRVSFDENYQILNVDELGANAPPASCPPAKLSVPSPSKQVSQPKQPALPSPSPAASPRKSAPAGVPGPKSPHKAMQARRPAATANAHGANTTTTTTSRGKAAIQSDVIEERGWIGFSTQHEDMATPVNGQEDEDPIVLYSSALVQQHPSRSRDTNLHVGRCVVKTITTGNCVPPSCGSSRLPDVSTNPVSGDGISVAFGGERDDAGDDDCSDTESFVTDSLNTKPSPPMHCCTAHHLTRTGAGLDHHQQLLFGSGTPMATVIENRPSIGACHRSSGHGLMNGTATDSVKEIREENAWHVYQTADCKVIQSKIEYYETTSIHRTPVTAGSQHHHHHNHQSCGGAAGDLFGPLVEHAPSPDSFRHGLSTADSLEAAQHQQQQLMASLRTPGRTARSTASSSVEPPKTSETTCSSCCFCNPELHRATGTGSVRIAPETCFYCHAKSQSPHKSFPAPPTPPNIQTSPVPPSPQTPIAELTPTPSLPEITLPEKRKPLVAADPPHQRSSSKELRAESLKGSTVTSTTAKSMESNGGSVTVEATKKTEHTKLSKAKASDTISTRGSVRPNEKPKRSHPPVPPTGASGSSTAQTASSTGTNGIASSMPDTGQKSTLTPKLGRKKSEAVCSGVLNRPKHTNHLVRASTVVHSVQKEVKNELKAPLKLLPKTAKELSNRKEKERQIGLSLPLGTEQKAAKSRHVLVPSAPSVPVPVIPPMVHSVTAVMVDDRCGSDSQSYDEASSTASCTPDTSPNSSPFKKATGLNVPPAAARWKTNSERNLSQLSIQKMVSASKWGNKWRKGTLRTTTDRQDDEEEHGRDRATALKGAAGGSCSDLSPLKTFTGSETVGFALGDASAAAGGRSGGGVVPSADTITTAGPSIINGIMQTATNQGWTVTVAGNYNPEMAPDVEMRLSFPKGSSTTTATTASNALTGGGSGGKSLMSSSAATTTHLQHDTSSTGYQQAPGRHRQYMENGPGGTRARENYGVLEHGDGGYLGGGSRNASRAAALPPPVGLNPKRSLTRSDGTGTGGGGSTAKDYRLPNVGPAHNVLARPTAKKAIKTVECSVVASATRTIANNYHELSHQHQTVQEGHHLQQHPQQPPQHHFSSRGLAAGLRSNRSRPVNVPQASAQILHPTLQNGSGGKFLSSSSPSLVSQQQHPSQRMHHPEPPYHLEDYGSNVYFGHQQQQHQQARRMSLESQHPVQLGSPAMDCLSIMGNAIAPELKPKVPTMSEKDLTRRHHPCYTRTQPYFS